MIAHLDCSTGISGDKFLGALINAGFAENHLRTALAPLGIAQESVEIEQVDSHGIAATSVRLTTKPGAGAEPARDLADIRELISDANLPERVAARALGVFELIAAAEARVHGTTPDQVHFHELGALDTILDVVGVALGLEALGIAVLHATPPALGGGTIECSHGTLPVPAPATVELLRGIPTTPGPAATGGGTVSSLGELTTPTGAALVRAFASTFGPMPAMTPSAVGYGAGTREIGMPNVARIVIGDAAEYDRDGGPAREQVTVLETNIDHLTPEQLAFCAEELLADGALDVWQSPIVMKKGRAAVTLSLMCAPPDAEHFAERMHSLTGTLGVRRTDLTRTVLAREERTMDTRHGPVRAKVTRAGGTAKARAEHEEVARIARQLGRPIAEVAIEIASDLAEAAAEL